MNLLAQNGGDSSKMESLLTCPICLDLFTKPVVILPCQHCLCRSCAEECFDKRGTRFGLHGGRFKCPTCRYEVVLDRHGVFGLNRNLLVESIIDMMEDEKKNEDKGVENKIKAAEEAEKQKQLDEVKKSLENAGKQCDDHGDTLNVYCLTCQKLICATCKVFGDCQTCSVVRIEQAFEQQQQEMREAIRLTTSATDGVQSAVTHCEDLVNRTRQIGGDSLHQINAQFDKIIKAMEDKKSQLMRKVQVETDTVEQQINNHAGKYSAALYGANADVQTAWTLAEEEDQIKFLKKSRPCIDRMMQHQSDMQVRPPHFQPPNPAKWRLELSPMVDVIRKIDFGDMSRQQLKSQSSAMNIKRNQSSDSLDEAPIMSKIMISPASQRKIIHAPVQVPGFHRGGFTIPANSMSNSSIGLRNESTSLTRNESRGGLFHIESESEQVGSGTQRFTKKSE